MSRLAVHPALKPLPFEYGKYAGDNEEGTYYVWGHVTQAEVEAVVGNERAMGIRATLISPVEHIYVFPLMPEKALAWGSDYRFREERPGHEPHLFRVPATKFQAEEI